MTTPDPHIDAFMAAAARLIEDAKPEHPAAVLFLLALTKAATDALAGVVGERDAARLALEKIEDYDARVLAGLGRYEERGAYAQRIAAEALASGE